MRNNSVDLYETSNSVNLFQFEVEDTDRDLILENFPNERNYPKNFISIHIGNSNKL